MKTKVFAFLFASLLCLSTVASAEYVNAYTRKDGTYVQGHNRSERNDTVRDNYSYAGNTNPYTGETGSNHYRNNSTSEYYNGSNSGSGLNRYGSAFGNDSN